MSDGEVFVNSPNGEVWKWMGKHWAYVGENAFSRDFNKNLETERKDITVTESGGGVCVKKECGVCVGENCLLGTCEHENIVDVFTKVQGRGKRFEDWKREFDVRQLEVKKAMDKVSEVDFERQHRKKIMDTDALVGRTESAEAMGQGAKKTVHEEGSKKSELSLKYEDVGSAKGTNFVMRLPTFEETEREERTTEKRLEFLTGSIGKNGVSGLWSRPKFEGEK